MYDRDALLRQIAEALRKMRLYANTSDAYDAEELLRLIEPVVAADMRERAAKAVDYCLFDVAEDSELFMAHRDYFAAMVRALPIEDEKSPARHDRRRGS